MRPFAPGDIRRLVVNPFYAITVAPPLVAGRPSMEEGVAAWLARNAAALEAPAGRTEEVRAVGEAWLRRLLDALRRDERAADPANPARAIAIAPIFAAGHPPLITEADWVRANVALLREVGARAWLETLLRVLQGDFVAAPAAGGADARRRPPRGGRSARRDPHAHRRRRR